MIKYRALIVEDEEDILELLKYNLSKEGFEVSGVGSGEDGLALANRIKPDIVILDLMLPGLDGLEVCRRLRASNDTSSIPIIMLTAKGEESDIVSALELGADDYVIKPFSPKVLIARVKSVIRRRSNKFNLEQEVVNISGLKIIPKRHEVFLDGNLLDLTSSEFKILYHLATHPGWVFTRQQIIKAVHGSNYPVTGRSIDVQVVSLRKKLSDFESKIETVRGVGYRFQSTE